MPKRDRFQQVSFNIIRFLMQFTGKRMQQRF